MRNLAFVAWMLGYCLVCLTEQYVIRHVMELNYSTGIWAFNEIVNFAIWVIVGSLLYERKETDEV